MMDRALENAKNLISTLMSRKAELVTELEDVDSRIQKTTAFIQQWYEFADGASIHADIQLPGLTATGETRSTPSTQSSSRPKNPSRRLVADKTLELIRNLGEPIPRENLLQLLSERGIHINGKDPLMVLSTMLWREKDKIVRLPKHGYWIADQEYKPAHYSPELEDLIGSADTTEPEKPDDYEEEDEA